MDESFRKAVWFAVDQINPMLSRSCPLSDLCSDQEIRTSILDRFVMYNREPPAMMHINRLLFYAGQINSSQTPEFDGVKFIQFFAPQYLDTTTLAIGGSIFDVSMSQKYLSHEKDGPVDDILRESLLQAAEKLKEQFSSLSPSPADLLLQSYSAQGDPQNYDKNTPLDKASIDAAFSNATKAALFELNKTDQGKSSFQLMELLIGEASKFDSAVKMAMGERIVLSSVPHPEISGGSDVLSIGLHRAVLRVQSDLWVKFPVETIIAAIQRLPAEKEVKLLLQFVILEMIEIPQTILWLYGKTICLKKKSNISRNIIIPRRAIGPRASLISMRIKFKIPNSSSTFQDEPQRFLRVSSTLLRSINVDVF